MARLISAEEWSVLGARADAVRKRSSAIRAASHELRQNDFRAELLRLHRTRGTGDDGLTRPRRP